MKKLVFSVKGANSCPFLHDDSNKVGPECNAKYYSKWTKSRDMTCTGVISEDCPLNIMDEIVVRRSVGEAFAAALVGSSGEK